jgi:hypothetical protein
VRGRGGSVESLMSIAASQGWQPWQLGVQQCSYAREWTDEGLVCCKRSRDGWDAPSVTLARRG